KVNVLGLEWAVVAEIDKPEALAAVSNITMWIIGVAIIISVLVAIIGLFIGTSFAKPILAGAQFSTAISQRDLTQTLHTKITSDEIGEMSQALVTMNKNLQDVVIEMSEVSATLAATSEEINAAATNLSEGAQNQAASVEETSASTEELTSSIKQVSDHTLTMQTKSEKSLSEAQAYKINMNQVSEEMVNISQSTEKIGDIVKVINDIADQTNLLSLNAAIEAARAGEHGRGFAVVAEAISTLATRSADSTKEIEKLVGETISRINKGVDSVKRSSDSFTAIISTIEENNGIVNEITKSMEDQHQGSEQIQKATEEINNLTQNISASAEEMASSTSELHNLAERLNGIVGTFKSKNGDSHHITQKVKLAITNDSKKKAVNT
ncbi:MAG: methyl-accepting chemotaxis protein, partial [Spirochaetota bacterium]|nr:methyl-accepting chemotaxis protein [Spirochaetota bacterium]